MRVISKVSITGNTLFCQDHKHLSNFSAVYVIFIMLCDVTTYDMQKT